MRTGVEVEVGGRIPPPKKSELELEVGTLTLTLSVLNPSTMDEISSAIKNIFQESIEVGMSFTPSVTVTTTRKNEGKKPESFVKLLDRPLLLPFLSTIRMNLTKESAMAKKIFFLEGILNKWPSHLCHPQWKFAPTIKGVKKFQRFRLRTISLIEVGKRQKSMELLVRKLPF